MTTTISVEDLREVYTSSKEDEELQPFVDIGNMVVNEQFNTACGIAMSQDRKDKIAVYVAAYFADVSNIADSGDPGPVKSEKQGDASMSYAIPDQTEAGYTSSKWGQLAIALDTCNILLSSPKLKAQVRVVGDNHIGTGLSNRPL